MSSETSGVEKCIRQSGSMVFSSITVMLFTRTPVYWGDLEIFKKFIGFGSNYKTMSINQQLPISSIECTVFLSLFRLGFRVSLLSLSFSNSYYDHTKIYKGDELKTELQLDRCIKKKKT